VKTEIAMAQIARKLCRDRQNAGRISDV